MADHLLHVCPACSAPVPPGYMLVRTRASTGRFATRPELERAIRVYHGEGLLQSEIAREVEVSQGTVSRVLRAAVDGGSH